MKSRWLLITAVLVASFFFLGQQASTQENGQGAMDPAKQAEMMQKWMKIASPSEGHEKLAPLVGKWKMETEIWMGGQASQSMKSEGSAEFSWTLGKRYVEYRNKGSMMGMPVEARGFLGYDNYKKKYVGVHMDTMGTHMLVYGGHFPPSQKKSLVMYGDADEFTMDMHDRTNKYVWKFVDEDTLIFEVHDLHIGEPNTKVVEVTYSRQK